MEFSKSYRALKVLGSIYQDSWRRALERVRSCLEKKVIYSGVVKGEGEIKHDAKMRNNVKSLHSFLTSELIRDLEYQYSLAAADAEVRVDLVIGGEVVMKAVRVDFLKALERLLEDYSRQLKYYPTLPATTEWKPSSYKGIFKSLPETRRKNSASPYSIIKLSGAVSEEDKERILLNIQRILEGVKLALVMADEVKLDTPQCDLNWLKQLLWINSDAPQE